jgi:hypothetical protein
MSSYISPFRGWLLALAAFVAIEIAYLAIAKPARFDRNNFLQLQYAQDEQVQRAFVHEKLLKLSNSDPDIIHVGDSSGYHGAVPPIVMAQIPGYRYVNMGVATNLGYRGYYHVAEYMLQKNKNIRHVVLYVTTTGAHPRKALWDGSKDLMAGSLEHFPSPFYRAFEIPTLAARKRVTDFIYYANGHYRQAGTPISNSAGYTLAQESVSKTLGWTRETDNPGDITPDIWERLLEQNVGALWKQPASPSRDDEVARIMARTLPKTQNETFFDWGKLSRRSYIDAVLSQFDRMVRSYNAQLIVVVNPIPVSINNRALVRSFDLDGIWAEFDDFRKKHPTVLIPRGFDYWPDHKFSVFSHVGTLYADESSERVGKLLAEVLPPRAPRPPGDLMPASVPVSVDRTFDSRLNGYGWEDEPKGATAPADMREMGPRHFGMIFESVKPGQPMTLRISFAGTAAEKLASLRLSANRIGLKRVAEGDEAGGRFIEWIIPQEAVNKWNGWLMLDLDMRDQALEMSDPARLKVLGPSAVFAKRIRIAPVSS